MKGTEGDCGWGRVQKEGLVKIGVKRLADFSGWAESGDDTDRVEKEDATSEVVETKIEQGERDVYYTHTHTRATAATMGLCKQLSEGLKPVPILRVKNS